MTEQYFSVSNSERLDMTGVTTVRRKYERMYAKITKSGCVDVGKIPLQDRGRGMQD